MRRCANLVYMNESLRQEILNQKHFSTSGVQWGCRSGGGLGVEGVLVQLGLRPVLLLLPNHPHHNRSQTLSWSTRFLSSSRLWKFCRRNIWGPAFLSPVWDDWWERLEQNKKQILMKHVSSRDSSDVVSPCWRRWSHGWRSRGRLVSTFFRRGPCLTWKK